MGAGHCVFDYRGTRELRDPHPIFWPGLSNNMTSMAPAEVLFSSAPLPFAAKMQAYFSTASVCYPQIRKGL